MKLTLLQLFVLVHCVWSVDWDEKTRLDEYVHYDDGYYGWTETVHYEYDGVDMYIVNMTSQYWMGDDFSDHSLWWHEVIVAIPHEVRHPDAALMAIDGGKNKLPRDPPPQDDKGNLIAAYVAKATGSVASYIKQIPNQPIIFKNDPSGRERSEDAQIAWTWKSFIDELKTGKPEPEIDSHMIARFPMTKAAKRGMDAVTEIAWEKAGLNITRFGVVGASKRGWTTWSIAAVDRRVISITPMVMSLLNMPETLQHHFRSMDGAWSFAYGPYYEAGLTPYFIDPLGDQLWRYEDMYNFKERLTIPKLVISGAGDEFFLCTDTHYWLNDMPGDTWLMMNPNTGHGLFPHYVAVLNSITAFWISVIDDLPIPKVTSTREETETGGVVRLWTDTEPLSAVGFRAVTLPGSSRRDFRQTAGTPGDVRPQPVVWRRMDVVILDSEEGYAYELQADKIEDKWVATFIQVQFKGPGNYKFRLTSEVHVVPDTFPYAPCKSEGCLGYLV